MGNAIYSQAEIIAMGRQYYQKLVKICGDIEQEGYWRQTESVMKQSVYQILDLYVQSLMVGLAVHMESVSEAQWEYMHSITDSDPLELVSQQNKLTGETMKYAEKYAEMPPVLIQICGVFDTKGDTKYAAVFMDTLINVLLCMMEMTDRADRGGQAYIRGFFQQTVMFVCAECPDSTYEESYILHKLNSRKISSGVSWLMGERSQKEQPGKHKKEKSRIQEQQKTARQEFEKEKQRIEEKQRTAEKEFQKEKQRLEEEQRAAQQEFQKVKKRLQEREKAEKEAREKKIAALLEELNRLVGLEAVKEEIHSLVNLIKVREMREKMDLPMMDMSYHMVFTGNPGTGKTTVARLVARIYRELGILSGGQLVETDRSRLVAGYVGQTAINVREVVEQALGGVLFIDEAYALISPDASNDYGSEAVDTLVKMMEDHRDDLVVIVAGYTEEMKSFLRSNTGLISRFNKFISFEDYTQAQLLEILKVMAGQAGMTVEENALKRIGLRLAAMNEQERQDFGNARGVRNLFEKMIVNQANRLVTLEEPTREQLMTLTEADV